MPCATFSTSVCLSHAMNWDHDKVSSSGPECTGLRPLHRWWKHKHYIMKHHLCRFDDDVISRENKLHWIITEMLLKLLLCQLRPNLKSQSELCGVNNGISSTVSELNTDMMKGQKKCYNSQLTDDWRRWKLWSDVFYSNCTLVNDIRRHQLSLFTHDTTQDRCKDQRCK